MKREAREFFAKDGGFMAVLVLMTRKAFQFVLRPRDAAIKDDRTND